MFSLGIGKGERSKKGEISPKLKVVPAGGRLGWWMLLGGVRKLTKMEDFICLRAKTGRAGCLRKGLTRRTTKTIIK